MNVENKAGETCGDCKDCHGHNKCGCGHHMIVPLLIIIIGVVLLIGGFNAIGLQTLEIITAILVIIIGGAKLMARKCKCC